MSKVSNTILLLKILESGKIYKIKELADLLECSPRSIRTYKEDLEKAGIYITTILGKYGGYVYNNREKIDYYTFNKLELGTLENLYTIMKRENLCDDKMLERLVSIIEKIRYFALQDTINKRNSVSSEKTDEYYRLISNAINNNKQLLLHYVNSKKVSKVVTFKPQNIYIYDDTFFTTGVVKEIKQIRTFSFNNIQKIEII